MADYPNYIAEIIPADLLDEMTDNRKESLTDMGIAVMGGTKQALIDTQATQVVIAYDDITTSGSVYFQYANGSIKKWGADNIRYSAPAGTLWANRSAVIYTAETV